MYVHWPTWRYILRRSLRDAPHAPRRATRVAQLAAAHGTLLPLVRTGRALDPWLYPDLRNQRTLEPVFITATPRSGTTLLYRLLSLDDARFASVRLYQSLLPSVLLERSVRQLARADRHHGAHLRRLLEAIEQRWLAGWSDIHPLGFEHLEEDESHFVYAALSPGMYLLHPFPDELPHLWRLDAMRTDIRRAVARDYQGTLQRLVFAAGGAQTPLIKNVLLAGRLQTVRQAFPDARFICLVRHPYESIASAVSMFHRMWRTHSPQLGPRSAAVRALAAMWIEDYRRLHTMGQQLPAHQWLTLPYGSLVAHPRESVLRIYRWLGAEPSAEFLQRLQRQIEQERHFRSRHRYRLEDYGLSRAHIFEALRDCFADYGFSPEGPDAAAASASPRELTA